MYAIEIVNWSNGKRDTVELPDRTHDEAKAVLESVRQYCDGDSGKYELVEV